MQHPFCSDSGQVLNLDVTAKVPFAKCTAHAAMLTGGPLPTMNMNFNNVPSLQQDLLVI